jgi:RNA polymerase sigma-70 factor (ECF subfamily)
MSEGPSAATIRAAGTGDETALSEVLGFLYPIVLRFLGFRFSGLRGGVEDATQECMIEIIRSLKHYRGDGTLRAWALRLSFRTARRLRDRAKRHEGPSDDELPESVFSVDADDHGLAVDLLRALEQVSDKKRDALILTEVIGLTAVEAARVLGTFENTVRSRARHAKAELRALLEAEEAGHA